MYKSILSDVKNNYVSIHAKRKICINNLKNYIIPIVKLLTDNLHILNINSFSYIDNIINYVYQLNLPELFRDVTYPDIILECSEIINNCVKEFTNDIVNMFKNLSICTNRKVPLTIETINNLQKLNIIFDFQNCKYIIILDDTQSNDNTQSNILCDPITGGFITSPYFFQVSNDITHMIDRITYYNCCRTGRNPFTNMKFDNTLIKEYNDSDEIIQKRHKYMNEYNPNIL